MKRELIKTRRNGFVVVLVLCMVMLLGTLLFGFNYKSRMSLHRADGVKRSAQALNCARAGLNIAIAVVRDCDDIYTDADFRKLLDGQGEFGIGDGKCTVAVTEENGKLNINGLKDDSGRLNRAGIDRLLRLIDLLNQKSSSTDRISYSLVAEIIDWTDSDDEVSVLSFVKDSSRGAESSYYGQLQQGYRCKNSAFEVAEELVAVKSVTPEVFGRICDYVTVYGDGEININSAEKIVIESLSGKMDSALAEMIVDRRRIKPFESKAELRGVAGMTEQIYNGIKDVVTVSSENKYYCVTSTGKVDNANCKIVAIIKKNTKKKNVDVVLYREFSGKGGVV